MDEARELLADLYRAVNFLRQGADLPLIEQFRPVDRAGLDMALVHTKRYFESMAPETPANARLKAAAPDMLAALTTLVNAVECCGGPEDFAPDWTEARAAIAKATNTELPGC